MKVYQLDEQDNEKTKDNDASIPKEDVIAADKTVWMGVDVHKDNAHVHIVDEESSIFDETIPMGYAHFESIVRRLPGCTIQATYEAGCIGYKPLRWLREAGCDHAFLTAPSMVPERSGDRVKTDRRDATKLARCLRGGMLDPAYDMTDEAYQHRQLVRSRKQMIEHRTRIRQQIKSMLDFHGVEIPERLDSQWSNAFLEWLSTEPTGRPQIDRCLQAFVETNDHLTEQIKDLTQAIKALAETDTYAEDVELLKTIDGVGLIVAMTFLVEIPEVNQRFETCEELSSYLGLTPSETRSNGKGSKGSIPGTGNARVRTELVQASWHLIGRDDAMREVYERIKAKHAEGGPGIAIIAVARRLGLTMRAMLRDETEYNRKAG